LPPKLGFIFPAVAFGLTRTHTMNSYNATEGQLCTFLFFKCSESSTHVDLCVLWAVFGYHLKYKCNYKQRQGTCVCWKGIRSWKEFNKPSFFRFCPPDLESKSKKKFWPEFCCRFNFNTLLALKRYYRSRKLN
jgi:hypothetical protein